MRTPAHLTVIRAFPCFWNRSLVASVMRSCTDRLCSNASMRSCWWAAIRRTCERMLSRAQRLSPPARVVLVRLDAIFFSIDSDAADALQSKHARFPVAYGAQHRTAQSLAQSKPHEDIAPMSWWRQRTTPQTTLLRPQSEMSSFSVHPGV